MAQALPWLVWLAMAGYHFLAIQTIHLMLSTAGQASDLFLGGAGFCLGILLASIWIDRTPHARRTGRGWWLAGLLVLAVFQAAARLVAFDAWRHPAARIATQAGAGFLLVTVHWLFFTVIPPRRAGPLYCAAMAAGFAGAEIYHRILVAPLPGMATFAAPPVHRLLVFTTLVVGFLLSGCVVGFTRERDQPMPIPEHGEAGVRFTWSVLGLVAVFFLLHGLINNAFLPFYDPSRAQDAMSITMAVTVFVVAAGGGWLIVRGSAKGSCGIITGCGVLYMAMPVLALLSQDAGVVRIVQPLAGAVQYLFLAVSVMSLAAAAPPGWRVLAMTAPFALKTIEVLMVPSLLGPLLSHGGEIVSLVAVVTAAGFYALGQKTDWSCLRAVDEANGGSRGAEPDELDPTAAARRLAVVGLGQTYGFSSREGQVAELLARGLQATEIGLQLGLSTNTVNTYVRRILVKTGCSGRRDLLRMLETGPDATT